MLEIVNGVCECPQRADQTEGKQVCGFDVASGRTELEGPDQTRRTFGPCGEPCKRERSSFDVRQGMTFQIFVVVAKFFHYTFGFILEKCRELRGDKVNINSQTREVFFKYFLSFFVEAKVNFPRAGEKVFRF